MLSGACLCATVLGEFTDDGYFHACGFILKPDGTVRSAVYSAGAIGRFRPEESLEQVNALAEGVELLAVVVA